MPRHDLDPVALVFGATFTAIGLAYAIGRWSWIGIAHGWLAGAFLIVLGVAGVISATTRDHSRALPAPEGADDPPD